MHHVLIGYDDFLLLALFTPFSQNLLQLIFGLLLGVPECCGLLKILSLDRPFFVRPDFIDFNLDILHIRRTGHGADPGTGSGFIQYVDGFIWQKATSEITIRKFNRCLNRFIGKDRLVVHFILWLEPFQNKNCLIHSRRLDFHTLEPTLQSRVFFNIFAIFVQRSCANALEFTPAKSGFNNVRSIHRSFSGPGSNNGMKFINEQNDVFSAPDFIHYRLDPLFKLATIFGASHHQREVKGDDFFIMQNFRDIAGHNLLG